jgi:hypothetical protein
MFMSNDAEELEEYTEDDEVKEMLEFFTILYEEDSEHRFDQEDYDFLQELFKREDFDFSLFQDFLLDAIEIENLDQKACLIIMVEDSDMPLNKLLFKDGNGEPIFPQTAEEFADWLLGV